MTTTVLSDDTATIVDDNLHGLHWGAVIAGAAVAAATILFLVLLGAGFGLMLMPRTSAASFFTLGAIYVLAAQAFGFAAGGHVTGRLIGPAVETKKEEEFRAGSHGLVTWAITVVTGLVMLALLAAGAGGARLHGGDARSENNISAYWADILLRPEGPHAFAKGDDLTQDKTEAARILAAEMHPGVMAHEGNRADLIRLAAMDGGLSYAEATDRVNYVESRMAQEVDAARKGAAYAALWAAFALLFGAVVSVAAAISARWEDDKLSFSMARRY